ncbi:TetR/AcrR family transcriptional regulator [Breoghania sp.]|uniref:TetR/AcrR family transcriptional regulator n=1 Tax=Breoghania sp. TaxID=2065378 RepID=UPI002AABB27C|nr:TetR/AcrR family transcriptional regulator [Breoghania sp.]
MARHAAFDRQETLQKALRLFWAKGYQGTSLKDLEKALDLRPGSIYAAFGSKEELFCEALRAYSEAARRNFEETVARGGTTLSGLAAHIRGIGRPAGDDAPARACMLVKTLLETPDEDPKLRRLAEDMMRAMEGVFKDAFHTAREAGELPADADPERLAWRLQADIFGLRTYAQRTDAADRVPYLADDIARGIEALRVN